MTQPLRILMTNAVMRGRTGTEIVTRDIALGLLQAGHLPTVYSPSCGPIAGELVEKGIPVKASAAELEGPFDLIHGNHLVACAAVLARFPDVPAIAVCHDGESWFDAPPLLPNVVGYAAISEVLCQRVMVETGLPRERVDLVLNGVDMQRFTPGGPLPERPQRALAFAKHTQHVEAVRAGCAARGVSVDFIGGAVGAVISDPERVLPTYDLIFGSAVSALEAMACLRPVIVCDGRGLAGMADRARLEAWRPHNFGAAVLKNPVTPESIAAEIDRYDAREAEATGQVVRQVAALPDWVKAYEQVYVRALERFRPAGEEENKLAWARHLERWSPRSNADWRWAIERQGMLVDLRRHIAGLDLMPRGRAVRFGNTGEMNRIIAPTGFDGVNADSVWTSREVASLRLHLGELRGDLEVVLDCSAHLPQPDFEWETAVLVNGVPVHAWSDGGFSGWRRGQRTFVVPQRACQGMATWLTFKFAQRAGAPPQQAPSFALHTIEVRG